MLISDWCDGQRPNRGRGRIYRVSHQSTTTPLALQVSLDAPGYHNRVGTQLYLKEIGDNAIVELRKAIKDKTLKYQGRMHAVWVLANSEGPKAMADLMEIAKSDSDSRVRVQAIRAIADLTDPILAKHRLNAGRGSSEMGDRIAKLGEGASPRVQLEVIVALGRLRWQS